MTKQTSGPGESRIAAYFAVLGLGEDAGGEELEERYRALSEYLTSPGIPPHLEDWARRRAELVDEAYAVLADAEWRSRPEKADTHVATEGLGEGDVGSPGASARARIPPARRKDKNPSWASRLPWRKALVGSVAGIAVLGAVVLGRYGLPGGNTDQTSPDTSAQADATARVDPQSIAELMQTIQQDPNNKDALFQLGQAYFLAGKWQESEAWLTKLVAIDPKNVFAITDIGTTQFSQGFPDKAKATWLAALQLAPDDPQLHYNMGFLFANSKPPDRDSARAEWQLVMKLAPGTDLAQTASMHMQAMQAESSAAAASPTGAALSP
jgi:tetratricopeptide (TPR) repeat protein